MKSQVEVEVERIKGRNSNITSCFKKDKLKRLKISISASYNLTVSKLETSEDPFEFKFVKDITIQN
jgi:hypothetical protein